MDLLFLLTTLATLPIWLLLLTAPTSSISTRIAQSAWPFIALGVLYVVVLVLAHDGSSTNYLTLDGYQTLLTNDAAAVSTWVHFLAIDLFTGAWIVRDALSTGAKRSLVVLCVFLTSFFAPVGVAAYLLVRARTTGSTSLVDTPAGIGSA